MPGRRPITRSQTLRLAPPVDAFDPLPDDLLSLILKAVPFEARVDTLPRVCRRWATLLSSPGEHWADFRVALNGDVSPTNIDVVRAWLAQGARTALTRSLLVRMEVGRLPPLPACIDSWLEHFPALQHASLRLPSGSRAVTPTTLDRLGQSMPRLHTLRITCAWFGELRLDPAAATSLARLTDLRTLRVDGLWSRVPEWVRAATQLRDLHLRLASVDAAATPPLGLSDVSAALQHLTRLRLWVQLGRSVSWGSAPLPASLRAFSLVPGMGADGATLGGMWAKLAAAPHLESLQLARFDGAIQDGLHPVSRLTALKHLALESDGLSAVPEGVSCLQRLTELRLRGCCELFHFAWRSVAALPELEVLDVRHTGWRGPDAGDFQRLAQLPRLRCIMHTLDGLEGDGQGDTCPAADFRAAYAAHLDAGGVHSATLRAQEGGPLMLADEFGLIDKVFCHIM